MRVEAFSKFDFFTGVPDSLLQPLNDFIYDTKGIGKDHIVTVNEGAAVAVAIGYNISTGKVPVVYLQNSGLGNIVNPVTSLTNPKIYGIPMLFVIGWRGEPGVKDEPQHVFQGEITLSMLENIGINYYIIDKETTQTDFDEALKNFEQHFEKGEQCCFIVKKGALSYENKQNYKNDYTLLREEAIKEILKYTQENVIVATTGKISREVYENRETHEKDFLVVGGMGHASSIALGIAHNTEKNVTIIDGDGAVLMHMGALAQVGQSNLKNITHIVLNNSAHESVGGMPTVANKIDFCSIAKSCGYSYASSITDKNLIEQELKKDFDGPKFIEIKVALGSRDDLARPKEAPVQNKNEFVKNLLSKGENNGK